MPFYGREYYFDKKSTPCCLLPQSADLQKIQKSMLAGEKPPECQKCWNLEQEGIESERQLKNKTFDFYKDKDIKLIEEDCKNNHYSKQIIKIATSNLCNSTCITCNSLFSSKWAQLKNIPINYVSINNSDIQEINWNEVVMLSFVGGEPLYEKKNFEILSTLIKIENTDCFISFVTNGSVPLSGQQLEILNKFKNLNICISIDGIGPVFEYLRYPLTWDTLIKNINQFKKLKTNISVSYTISNLNILYYHETINWFKQQGFDYNHNMVTSPSYFNVNNLPVEIKKNLPLVNNVNQFDSNLFSIFKSEVENQDNLKGISIKNYLPELWKVLDDFEKN